MEKLNLPQNFEIKKISANQADIYIEPCFPGYGTTLGNALRRVLLSSLPGAAITAIKVKNISHEFSTLPGVKEDLVEIILNLKRLRFKLHNTDEAKAILNVKGEKKVKAKDIKITSEIEIFNPEAEIANLTTKDAELEIELFLKTGRGYLPVENIEKKKFQLGTIAIDAIFTPIKNVNYKVENVRVGQMTNYDRLILTILTDGTISPEEALKSAATILYDHFVYISELGKAKPKSISKEQPESKVTVSKEQKETEVKKKEIEIKKDTVTKPKKKRGRPKKE